MINLLTKLRRYGVNFNALQWISSYLSAREHFVSGNQTHSPTLHLNICVPQGSILGPFLSLIYFNNIVNSSAILSFVIFDDDTTAYDPKHSIDDAIQIFNTELSKVT